MLQQKRKREGDAAGSEGKPAKRAAKAEEDDDRDVLDDAADDQLLDARGFSRDAGPRISVVNEAALYNIVREILSKYK